ncbi:MAG: outer membrane protein assembly factor BamA [Pseudomonadota bacterium]
MKSQRNSFKSSKRFLSVCALALLGLPATQAQTITIADIRLEGLQRVAASSVFGLLNVNVGDQIDQADIANIVRDVFASDYFSDIQVLTEDNVLIIRVQERPTISDIKIDGNKLIPTEALQDNMEQAGLAVGQVFQQSTLEGMQLALEEQYVSQGMYGATVDVDIDEQDRNRVALNITVTEGDASKIVHINIVGNTVFDDEELTDLFELRTTHLTSMFKKDDRYAREKINGDLERLTSYYMDQGYVNFDVTSTQVSLSPDKEQVYITINISEGEVYTVDEVELAGDLVDSEELLRLMIQVGQGQVFSQQLVTSTSEFMTQLLGNRGYFFAEVEGVPNINEEDKTVDITFFVEPGARTYVNRVSFKGNTNTADEVMRREMRQMEGAPASKSALEASKERMNRLGYFKTVEYDTTEVPGTSDQIDVEYTVEEQLNGSVGGSLGYGQVVGLQLQANLQQVNFLGTGKTIGVNASTSAFNTNYNFNYFDPYYTIDGVSRGYSIGYSSSDYAELGLASYSTDQLSLSTSYGYQLSETQGISFNLGYSNTDIGEGNSPVQEIKASPALYSNISQYIVQAPRELSYYDPDTGVLFPIADAVVAPVTNLPLTALNTRKGFIDREGTQFNNFTMNVTWSESTLNFGLFPTAGGAQSLSLEVTIPGSDLNYYRLNYYKEDYFPLFGEWILHTRAQLGYGDGYGDTEELPFFNNYYAGGLGTVRGFERNSLGPRASIPQNYLVQNTAYLKDEDGNIILDVTGFPMLDENSPLAYILEQAMDADGNPLTDTTGLPIYKQRVSRENAYPGQPDPFGGNIQAVGTVELLFPLPFIKDRSKVRSGVFFDVGNVFSSYCAEDVSIANNCFDFDVGELRYSAGVSVAWQSGAFGIMSFSLAKAFNVSNIDEDEVFQFNLGNAF